MPVSIQIYLKENSSRGMLRGVGGDGKWFGVVWEGKYWFR